MNIYDISKIAGVSIATVSRVINNNPNVSEKNRVKVMAAIEESGYTPNVFARGLGLNTMKTIGVMCADSSDPYLAQAVYYIEQNLRKNNYDSLLSCTGYDHETKKKCIDLLLSKRVDAIILVGSNYVESDDRMNDYIRNAAKSVPVMLINAALNAPNVYSTLCDDFSATYEITERFIKQGKREILYLYNSNSYSAIRKLDGFRSAMKANKLHIDEKLIHFISSHSKSVHEVKQSIKSLCDKGITFDGVIASDDVLAIGAIKYAKETGISVPDNLFIAGYNNFDITEYCDPTLTSVDNKLPSLCTHCVATLMSVFSNDTSIPKQTIFSAEIIERQTTKLNQK